MERKDMNEVIIKQLGIHQAYIKQLRSLYLLRCEFSAHPAQSKWWDFSEIYDEDIDDLKDVAKIILIKFLMYKNSHRIIQPNPDKWSQWFFQYADIIFDAVWFHKLPELYN
jgi:hypothetical protein